MKKFLSVLLLTVFFVFGLVGSALAATEILPKGAMVSAAVDKATATARVTVRGVIPIDVELYNYKGVKHLGAVTDFDVNLREGRRFNFTFNEDTFALLTPEMAAYPPDFFGPGIGMDCSGSDGCCFMITGE